MRSEGVCELRRKSVSSPQAKKLRVLLFLSLLTIAACGALLLTQAIAAAQPLSSKGTQGANASALTPTPTPTCGLAWRVVPSANQGEGRNQLSGVAAISSNDVWAVGHYELVMGTPRGLVLHWDGSSWNVVPTPVMGPNYNLYGVTAVSANDVWAVGYYFSARYLSLVFHWDGNSWSHVPSPNAGASNNYLYGVTAVSANDVWAVGTYWGGSADQTLVLHWNGSSWARVPSPNVGTGSNQLRGVSGVSANNAWAVGWYTTAGGGHQTLMLRWNGSSWAWVPSLNPCATFNYLYGVEAISANDAWAVGYCGSGGVGGPFQTMTLHWDGSTWSYVPSPNVGTESNRLYGVSAVSGNDVWAVGSFMMSGGEEQTLVLRWTGSSWSHVPSPNVDIDGNTLYGVSARTASDVWAVGFYWWNGTGQRTLVERYNEPCCPIGPDYQVSATGGATIVPGTTYVPGSTCDSCTVNINLPFSYDFYGTPYTQVMASNKGNLQFISNNSSGANVCPLPAATFNDTIFAYWDDLNTNINDVMGIYTSVTGSAPDRIFNIEWRAGYEANDATANFEVRLYEGQPKFEVVYGTVHLRGFSTTIGVQKGTGERYTQYSCNTQSVQMGTKLTFDRRLCPP